ncbi:flavin reductase family protein [Paenarthrobacter sp. NPDC058040]|uniref:flavin reductase family protein n=1 Tax=unclassified Paenarthrobacter TaxID=2634190 RepID=UPI0036DDC750
MDRLEVDARDIDAGRAYQLLTALVVPRPIAWITTQSAAGIDNIAPFSFSGVVASDPPLVMFSTVGWKDSAVNARERGEFVFNLAPASRVTQINETAIEYPPHVDEFTAVGLTKASSVMVSPPRIAESPAALECRVTDVLERGNGVIILGQVLHFSIAESCLVDGDPDFDALAPVGRLSGPLWALPGSVHHEPRIKYQDP